MRWKHWLIIVVVMFLAMPTGTFGQGPKTQTRSVRLLTNRDVLSMVHKGMRSDLVIATILTSPCNFDIFPPVLDDLKRRGVPENVLQVMSVVPNGPPNLPETGGANLPSLVKTVKLPQGTAVLVETLYPISSADFKINNTIAFAVASPVFVDGALIIPRGTIARAKIVRVKKARIMGRGGALTFEMERIVAMDGTKIPVLLTAAAEGGSRTGVLAVGAAATSALIFPYTAPAALVWGFKKGDDAVVRGNKQFAAVIKNDIEVAGLVPDKDRVIYHYAESLKAKQNSTATPTNFPRLPVRN
ncbi:MAG TPA: hypothetical protein VKB02_07995 [Pyrinomonadaceae bacterium]|nr:hypothetical protein [Pyrinomonadaceae bacterium]